MYAEKFTREVYRQPGTERESAVKRGVVLSGETTAVDCEGLGSAWSKSRCSTRTGTSGRL